MNKIEVKNLSIENYDIEDISIGFGDKKIQIIINDTIEFDGVEITEQLFRFPQ